MDGAFTVQRLAALPDNTWLHVTRPDFAFNFSSTRRLDGRNGVLVKVNATSDSMKNRKRLTIGSAINPTPRGFSRRSPKKELGEIVGNEDASSVVTSDELVDAVAKPSVSNVKASSVVTSDELVDAVAKPSVSIVKASSVTDSDELVDAVAKPSVSNVKASSSEELEEESIALKAKKEADLRREIIEGLAEEALDKKTKVFCYPQTVRPDEDLELFFNRSLSNLLNEPDVLVMGAFNNWRWKSFTVRLNKSKLHGDWWSCEIHIPKEAYKIDFVFFNGQNVYENNDDKDFSISVNGGMDETSFEDYLLEEKRRELEKLAMEKAKRERQEQEQRLKEAEIAGKEEDMRRAKGETEKRREELKSMIKNAEWCDENIWYFDPREFEARETVRVYYNRSSGPLNDANDLWIHGGYNNWNDGLNIVEQLVKCEEKDGDWWYADVSVPDKAIVIDWVFADGPPQRAVVYDNNRNKDFHSVVSKSIPNETFWDEEGKKIFNKLQEERRLREEAIKMKIEKTAQMKAETKERTLKNFLLSQKHIVYTDPINVQAGSTVSIFYNVANSVLNGKPEVWFRCSFNRWTHRSGKLPPQRMVSANNGSLVTTTVKVPLDAYLMDFVFSERENGGLFDNRGGVDYHIPVSGGIVKEPPMHIVHISVEMAPIAKVGGLGDVVTSLSRAVQDLNHRVDVILPKYDCLRYEHIHNMEYKKSFHWGGAEVKVFTGKVEGISVFFLEPQNGLFSTGCVYGCRNDGERFDFFCHASLEFLKLGDLHPDIIHCHDWPSAPATWIFKETYSQHELNKAKVIFTIHNLEFGVPQIAKAMAFSDKCTTVSPTYAREVSGHSAIQPHLHKFHGILNGIDSDIWDPYNDAFLPVNYTWENVADGKRAAKQALQQRLNLAVADIPLVGIITRLTHQKGIHLIKHAIWQTINRGGQVVLLGSAPDPRIQNDFVNFANQLHGSHNDRARLVLTYDEPLSHLIYAGSDFILVPSLFEPCGLTQLTAMRYGSIPVVRETGGLYDTVFDVDHGKERALAQGLDPNGFSFDGFDSSGVDYALNRAISAWFDGREWFVGLCKRVMQQDWTWNRPALDYMELYHSARR